MLVPMTAPNKPAYDTGTVVMLSKRVMVVDGDDAVETKHVRLQSG
jgi:hypothetical protein